MATNAEPGAGDVVITLAGKEHTMVPSLQACMAISKIAGGAQNVISQCMALNFDTICEIVVIGTGYTSLKERRMVQEAIYETGTIAILAECVQFVRIVNNGGRSPEDDDGEGGGDETDAPLSPTESSIDA